MSEANVHVRNDRCKLWMGTSQFLSVQHTGDNKNANTTIYKPGSQNKESTNSDRISISRIQLDIIWIC